ncbi:hypothetical protein [Mycobacteroides abscessus]|nr:hypothetical protein [Mycobacteroides abscessus]MBN7379516.1 hypothetical protein [Mycobacteroides abscessus subsp. massiliense]MBN7379855.1 hypothetical protein [Mycobacteroides abscessus subsp. massiliense]MBN7505676.1 hypothetical protein [Mycobacteroides abscessus subsp. massiliense]MDE9371600.1 hypothetical protein [Mycobacteroides abscessus subsp. bolletii]MDM2097077.1 hypothetical protein [Mycobacteroides abscessus]
MTAERVVLLVAIIGALLISAGVAVVGGLGWSLISGGALTLAGVGFVLREDSP